MSVVQSTKHDNFFYEQVPIQDSFKVPFDLVQWLQRKRSLQFVYSETITSGNEVLFIDQNKVNNFHREPSIKYFCKVISKEVINGKH